MSTTAATFLALLHHAPLVPLAVDAAQGQALLAGSTFESVHEDGWNGMQVRRLATDALGGLRAGQGVRGFATSQPRPWGHCTVSDFVVEAQNPVDAHEATATPAWPEGDPPVFFARLDCGGAEGAPDLVRPSDSEAPGLFAEGPALDDTSHILAVLDRDPAWRTVSAGVQASWPRGELDREAEVRPLVRAGEAPGAPLFLVRGRLTTGEGLGVCGGEDADLPFAAIVEGGEAPRVRRLHTGEAGEGFGGVVDLDADGLPEVLQHTWFGGTGRQLVGAEGVAVGPIPTTWWEFCPC